MITMLTHGSRVSCTAEDIKWLFGIVSVRNLIAPLPAVTKRLNMTRTFRGLCDAPMNSQYQKFICHLSNCVVHLVNCISPSASNINRVIASLSFICVFISVPYMLYGKPSNCWPFPNYIVQIITLILRVGAKRSRRLVGFAF